MPLPTRQPKNTVNAGGSYNLWNINGLDYKSIYENEKFVSNVNTLKNNLAAYKKLLVTTTDAHDTELDQYISNMLNQPDDWMAVKFEGKHLIAVIDALNAIKSHIGSAGLEAILSIRDHYR